MARNLIVNVIFGVSFMRMRKKKHGQDRLEACREYLLEPTYEVFSDPSLEVFGESLPVYLEIGAGKGGFAIGMTEQNPDVAYFAMERVSDCVVLAAEKAKEFQRRFLEKFPAVRCADIKELPCAAEKSPTQSKVLGMVREM